jgi:yecA family protein
MENLFDREGNLAKRELNRLNEHVKANYKEDKIVELKIEKDRDIYWVEGFSCAIACAPYCTGIEDWIHVIHHNFDFESKKHEDKMGVLKFMLFNEIVRNLDNGEYVPLFDRVNLLEEDRFELAMRWIKGFLAATMLSHDDLLEDKEAYEILSPILIMLDGHLNGSIKITDEIKEVFYSVLPEIISVLYDYTQEIKLLDEEFELSDDYEMGTVVNDNKIGRNDPCHCGSGKRYKKCCLAGGG